MIVREGARVRPAAESHRAILQDAEHCLLRLLAMILAEHTGEWHIVTRQQAGLRRASARAPATAVLAALFHAPTSLCEEELRTSLWRAPARRSQPNAPERTG